MSILAPITSKIQHPHSSVCWPGMPKGVLRTAGAAHLKSVEYDGTYETFAARQRPAERGHASVACQPTHTRPLRLQACLPKSQGSGWSDAEASGVACTH